MELIVISGKAVKVPPEVVSDSRDAVQAWHRQQLVDANIPHVIFDGDPVELPADLVGKPKAEIEAWAATEAARRDEIALEHHAIEKRTAFDVVVTFPKAKNAAKTDNATTQSTAAAAPSSPSKE